MAVLAKKRNVTKMTISNAVRKDLGMNSVYRHCRNILTAKSKTICKGRSTLLLNHLKHHCGTVCIFVDEKELVVDKVTNPRNLRAIASDGKVMPPHFIEVGLKINRAEYLKILEEVLLP